MYEQPLHDLEIAVSHRVVHRSDAADVPVDVLVDLLDGEQAPARCGHIQPADSALSELLRVQPLQHIHAAPPRADRDTPPVCVVKQVAVVREEVGDLQVSAGDRRDQRKTVLSFTCKTRRARDTEIAPCS